MQDNEIRSLQDKLSQLLAIHHELLDEHESIKAARAEWHAERARLIQQNEAARRRVNEMIKKLQILERNSGH